MHRARCQGKWSNQRRRYSERLADTARRPAPSLADAGRPCWRRQSCDWYQLETVILSDSHLHLKFHHHALEEQTRDPGTDSKMFQTFSEFQPLGIFEICQEFMWPYLNDWRRNWQQFLGVGESLVWRTRCYKKFWLYTADYCCYARKDVEHLHW